MKSIGENDLALLALSAMKPIGFLPPFHLSVAENLVRRGFLRRAGEHWHPTQAGLRLIGRTVH